MFLRNAWYVVARASDLPVGTIAARCIIDIPVVLFRTASGAIGALKDHCGACGMRLSENAVGTAEVVRCSCNGIEYSRIGACVQVPGLDRVPGDYAVRAYPVVVRDGLVWLWPGSVAKADAAAVPSFPYAVGARWAATSVQVEVEANWELFHDRLLALNHLGYVHQNFAAGPHDARAISETSVIRDGNTVRVRRCLLQSEPSPFYRTVGGFVGKVDRWKEIDFQPGCLTFFAGAVDAGTGAHEGRRDAGIHTRHFHGIAPISETRTLYTFVQARNYRAGDDALTAELHELAMRSLRENQHALEERQRRLAGGLEPQLVTVGDDAGPAYARRIVAELSDVGFPSSRRAFPERNAPFVASSNSAIMSTTAPGGSSMTTKG